MNLLYRGCASKRGFQARILRELYRKGIFKKCTIITQTLDGRDCYPSDIYHEIPASYGYQADYDKICDMEMLPEVSEDILLKMQKYSNTAFNMTCRNYHAHIMYFDEMYNEYMKHIKYWNWILDSDKIDMVFLTTVPHHSWEYILYALAKVKRIPVLIETVIHIEGLNEVGTSIESLGENTKNYFSKKIDCELDDNVKKYFNKIRNTTIYRPSSEKAGDYKNFKKWIYKTYYKPLLLKVFKNDLIFKDIREGRTLNKLNNDVSVYGNNIRMLCRLIIKNLSKKGDYYYNRKLAQAVNFNKKYIYFALQYFPESSVLPRGGVFWNQLPAIKMLARIGQRYGIAVFVKEHWIEEGRQKAFYKELKSIPNVYILSKDEDTYKIIDSAIAVSSQTGSCMLESVLRGIPVLTFGDHYFGGAPGVFRVGNEKEIENVLKEIMNNKVQINQTEVERYFSVISQTTVKGYLDWPVKPQYDLRECISDTVMLIEEFVNSGMKEDFLFIKKQ